MNCVSSVIIDKWGFPKSQEASLIDLWFEVQDRDLLYSFSILPWKWEETKISEFKNLFSSLGQLINFIRTLHFDNHTALFLFCLAFKGFVVFCWEEGMYFWEKQEYFISKVRKQNIEVRNLFFHQIITKIYLDT